MKEIKIKRDKGRKTYTINIISSDTIYAIIYRRRALKDYI